MVLSVILTILKIIGIVLLSILGLFLLVVLVVLFVPIRYKITADSEINETKNEYRVSVRISWLLHLVRGRYDYPSEGGFVVKVGPFCVYGRQKKEKPEKAVKAKYEKSKNIDKSQKHNEPEETNRMPSAEYKTNTKAEESETEDKPKSIKEKILYTREKICDKISDVRDKIKDIIKNVQKYIHIIQSNEFEEAFGLCKSSVVRLLMMIKPRKVKIKGTAGLKSPEQTGYMCAVIGIISPFYKKQIRIIPDFENFIIEGNAIIKGRIYLFVILIIGVKAFFDKNIRKVMDMFQKEESVNG